MTTPPANPALLAPAVLPDSSPAGVAPPAGRPHLPFLDGLRGLAALYVAGYHILGVDGVSGPFTLARSGLRYGQYAVDAFIVLSGFCLMLPVVWSGGGRLRGGTAEYLRRRAGRILPPYYAALALSLVVIAVGQGLRPVGADWSAFGPGNLLSHLTLTHNLFLAWSQAINPPLWSVATEWQIYFFFPLLLLPAWRRFGAGAVGVGFALGLLPHYLLPAGANLDWACPWFMGLFALGMAGADAAFGGGRAGGLLQTPTSSGAAALALALLAAASHHAAAALLPGWVRDALVSLCVCALILYGVRCAGAARPPALIRLLNSRAAVGLGVFSYSIYLVHLPIWWVVERAVRVLHLAPDAEFAVRAAAGLPLTLAGCYLFYLAFERPAIARLARTGRRAAAPPPA